MSTPPRRGSKGDDMHRAMREVAEAMAAKARERVEKEAPTEDDLF